MLFDQATDSKQLFCVLHDYHVQRFCVLDRPVDLKDPDTVVFCELFGVSFRRGVTRFPNVDAWSFVEIGWVRSTFRACWELIRDGAFDRVSVISKPGDFRRFSKFNIRQMCEKFKKSKLKKQQTPKEQASSIDINDHRLSALL